MVAGCKPVGRGTMATAITNDMRERARKDDKYLVQVALYPKHLSDAAKAKFRGKAPTQFSFELTGPLGGEEAAALWRMCRRWVNQRKV